MNDGQLFQDEPGDIFGGDATLFDGDSTALEFDLGDFDLTAEKKAEPKTRYIKPKFNTTPQVVAYTNAVNIAKDVRLFPGEQQHFIVTGSFIFGDVIEALLTEKQVVASEVYISTLSLSQENADSLGGLVMDGWVERLTLCVSNYFYSHERQTLIPYILKAIDHGDKSDLLVVRTHMKVILLKVGDLHLVITGSANLRSSNSIEQFTIQESEELYAFYRGWFEFHRGHSIIDGSIPKGAPKENYHVSPIG